MHLSTALVLTYQHNQCTKATNTISLALQGGAVFGTINTLLPPLRNWLITQPPCQCMQLVAFFKRFLRGSKFFTLSVSPRRWTKNQFSGWCCALHCLCASGKTEFIDPQSLPPHSNRFHYLFIDFRSPCLPWSGKGLLHTNTGNIAGFGLLP